MRNSNDLETINDFATDPVEEWRRLFLYHLARGTGRSRSRRFDAKKPDWSREEFISAVDDLFPDAKLSTATYQSYVSGKTLPKGRWQAALFKVFWPVRAGEALLELKKFADALAHAKSQRKVQRNSSQGLPANKRTTKSNDRAVEARSLQSVADIDGRVVRYSATIEILNRLLSEFSTYGETPLNVPPIVNDVAIRAQQNVSAFSQFMHATRDLVQKPTLRLYGNFTSLSNSREPGSSDYASLLLEEVNLVDRFIQMGYPVRVIASLDVGHIVRAWTSRERLLSRTAFLIERLRRLEGRYSNLTVAVDTHNRMPGLAILGNSLTIRALSTSHGEGYTSTAYETDQQRILGDSLIFETAMSEIKQIEFECRKVLRLQRFADYFESCAGSRLHNAQMIEDSKFRFSDFV
jgi:hypothetical protein